MAEFGRELENRPLRILEAGTHDKSTVQYGQYSTVQYSVECEPRERAISASNSQITVKW